VSLPLPEGISIDSAIIIIIIIIIISARCNIYISRLCYDVSVRLSVTFVHCGHRVQWIPDIFACLDRWMSLLHTDNASPVSSDGIMPRENLLRAVTCLEKVTTVAP